MDVPILIPDSCVTDTSTLGALCWQFGAFFAKLRQLGVEWHQLPQDLYEVGVLNISSSGHRSNGARTSLRNLVVLEGLDFTRSFLAAADQGANRLAWRMPDNPFLAELEWLDLVGDAAPALLDDYGHRLHLLGAAGSAFFRSLKMTEYSRALMLEEVPDDLKRRYAAAVQNDPTHEDEHYARIYLYVMTHPSLEIVKVGDAQDARLLMDRRIGECANRIKGLQH